MIYEVTWVCSLYDLDRGVIPERTYTPRFDLLTEKDYDMSGILEQILADLQVIKAAVANGAAAPATPAQPAAAIPAAIPGPAPVADPLSMGAPAAPPVAVTGDQIMALITPHLENAGVKSALAAELAAMGIPGLPAAREDQYAEIYQRFQRAIAANAAPAGAPAAAPTSII